MAFKASGVTAAPAPKPPAAPPSGGGGDAAAQEPFFVATFGAETVAQMRRIVEDTIARVLGNRAFFRESDLVKGTKTRCQTEMKPSVIEHERFVELIDWAIHMRPLVEIGKTNTFTTPEMVEMERNMLDLAGREEPRHLLSKAITDMAIAAKVGISEEQTVAVEAACRTPRSVTVIEGTAGAGKSFTMQAIKEAYIASGYDVMGTAISWNAAKVLESATGMGPSQCVALEGLIQKMLKAREAGTEIFRGPTLLIVDEAGMVGTRHMFHLLTEAARSAHPIKIVLTGDSLQVNPVDAGNALQAIIEYHGTTRIDTIRRQKQESHRRAVRRFSKRQGGKGMYTFVHQEAVRWCADQDAQFNMVIRDYLSYRLAYPERRALILALRNKDVSELNRRLRNAYRKMGLIEALEVKVPVTDGRESWDAAFSVGDEVVLRANDQGLLKYQINPALSTTDSAQWLPLERGVYNRNAGRIVGIRRAAKPVGSFDFTVDIAGDSPSRVIINSENFRHPQRRGIPMVHNFATTIYASQGQTVQQVFMLDSAMMEFRLAYVGMSRHTDGVIVYLDETEIHERLDRMLGKSAPASAPEPTGRPGDADELPVKLGRYKRSEMLQAVASCWSKDSENLTAMIHERRKRLGKAAQELPEELAKVVQASADDPTTDFVPVLNVRWPLVDLERIMELPDPIVEAELVRPSEVEAHKMTVDPRVIPLRQIHDPHAPVKEPVGQQTGFSFSRALEMLHITKPKPPAPVRPVSVPEPSLRQADPSDPFAANPTTPVEDAPDRQPGATLIGSSPGLGPRRPVVAVPMLPDPPPVGQVDEEGLLRFEGVPQTRGAQGGPSEGLLKKTRGVLWDIGREQEPRILARDHQGAVSARYRLDGRCVVGEGQPPIWLNRNGNSQTPITLVPGPREWFWMAEHQRQIHTTDPEAIPHLVWAARDVDWGLIASALQGKKVQIARSKVDESQLAWALDLQKLLQSRWNITADITPRPPEAVAAARPRP